MPDLTLQIDVTKDTASIALRRLVQLLVGQTLKRYVGGAVTLFTQSHLRSLAGNKNGWPSQQFYQKAAKGTRWEPTADGVRLLIDNEEAPGAMRHQYNGGQPGKTTITSNGKLLAIPARAEFYGHSPREFDNLKFILFASGAKALVIGQGGTGYVTGSRNIKGGGARSQAMVAYWLKDKVEQDAKPEVLPTRDQYLTLIHTALNDGINKLTHGNN